MTTDNPELRPPQDSVSSAPYLVLFASLVVLFVLSPLKGLSPLVRWGVAITALVLVISALRCVAMRRRWFLLALSSGILGAGLQLASLFGDRPAWNVAGEACMLVCVALISAMIISHIFRVRHVTMDIVLGAACVYLLAGFLWAKLYVILEWLHPGSFSIVGPESSLGAGQLQSDREAQLTYYSYITLTTVGYGDVTPRAAPARTLAMLEGLFGQLYVAIMIARMVALQITHGSPKR